MTKSEAPPLSSLNQDSLRSLIRTIERSQGMFALILVRCNYQMLRDRVQAALREQLQVPFQEVNLQPQTRSLYTAIRKTLGNQSPTALIVNRLELVEDLDTLLRVANQSREEFRNNLPCPLVIWVTDSILNRLIRDATDFESWASVTLHFESELSELTYFVMETANDLFTQLLDSREHIFLDNQALDLEQNSPLRAELRSACDVIHQHLDPLPREVEASGQFILGRVADNNTDEAREHYERSLELWQQVGNSEHYGHVQFYLGFWWVNYAVRHLRDRATGLQKSKTYFEGAIQTFEEINQPHRVAQFINFLGEVLHRQEDWSALDGLAQKAFMLHQQYCDYFRQARALGFMAAVAIARNSWSQAEYQANQALAIWQTGFDLHQPRRDRAAFLDWERRFHRPWYLYFLGKAQRHNHTLAKATRNLEEARRTAEPSYDPELYIGILNELRDIYFDHQEYLKAYKTRQVRREIQSKFNFRPFVGPGRLQASQEITNPSLPRPQHRDQVAPEIETSGRQRDIEALIQRIERKDFRLSVVYGPSGVGKSSILQAGIIPILKQRTFEGRRVITVLQQVYKDWILEFGNQVVQACQEVDPDLLVEPAINSLEGILAQLQKNSEENFKTVLIFDQFEEFFFTNPNVEERYRFYNFAVDCFKILDSEVILSMKEDYLHFLLACNRMSDLDIIGNNILDKNILYYIGNFTREEAYEIVRSRTKNTRITFDDDLIDQMVKDLADTFNQVRPIELQIVGAQLQTNEITTLAKYQSLAEEDGQSRQVLVNRYLENVVEDCGPENQELAEIILYLLTNEDGTRPIRTKSELMQEKLFEAMQSHPEQIDLILGIFVQAGLVLLVPSSPVDSYQLVHDYLVNLIREKVQNKYQLRIAHLTQKVAGLDRVVRLLAVLLLSLVGIGAILYLLYRNNRLLYEVTQLERNSIENLSKFDGYQLLSLEDAIREVDLFDDRPVIVKRTTRHIHTLQYVLDNIAEKRWRDTGQVQIFAADVHGATRQVATGGLDQTVKIWSIDGDEQQTIDVSEALSDEGAQIWDVRFNAAGDRLAIIDSFGQLMLWSLDENNSALQTQLRAHDYENFLTRLITSPDRSLLATAAGDGFIRLWNADDLTLVAEWAAHAAPISSLYFGPDGETLVSADYESDIAVWRVTGEAGELVRTFTTDEAVPRITFGLAMSPDGNLLAAATEDGFIRIWDLNRGILQQRFLAHNGRWVTAIDFVPNPNTASATEAPYLMVTADNQGGIRTWSIDGNKSIQVKELQGHQGWIWSLLHTSRQGTADPQVISTGIDGSLRFWDLRDPSHRTSSLIHSFMGHPESEFGPSPAWSTSYSPSRALLATAGADGTANIWQLAPGTQADQPPQQRFTLKHDNSPVADCEALIAERQNRNNDVFGVVFAPDERIIATAGADCTARLWDSETGQPLMRPDESGALAPVIMPHSRDAFVQTVAFSPDGQLIATADSSGRVFLWSADGQPIGDPLQTAQVSWLNNRKQPVFAVKFSPDGNYLATASENGNVQLWQLQTTSQGTRLPTQPAATLGGHRNGATSIDFSGDGLIATAGKDGSVRIWQMNEVLEGESPEPIQELSAFNQRVTWIEFYQSDRPAAEMLATASKDGSVIIWDRSLEGWGIQRPGNVFKQRYQFDGHQDGAFSTTFIADGRQIAVAQGDGQIKLWHLENSTQLMQRACAWLGNIPTSSDRRFPKAQSLWAKESDPEIANICRKYE